MLAIKSSKKSLRRLLSGEEDNLLAGMDFQTYYLGRKEVQLDNSDLDNVVEGIYSKYLCKGDINNSTQLTITVDNSQLIFRDAVTHNPVFVIALTTVKSVYCSNKKTKYPNAVIVVCCLPSESNATVHVLHCLNQSKAKEFYNAINLAFQYNGDASNMSKFENVPNTTAFTKANKDIETNAVSGYKVNKSKPTKYRDFNITDVKPNDVSHSEGADLLAEEKLTIQVKQDTGSCSHVKDVSQPVRSRAKSVPQTKYGEERGLLNSPDSDDGFDDEFTSLARNRSISDNIKARFGR